MNASLFSLCTRCAVFGLVALTSTLLLHAEASAKGEVTELHMISQGSQRLIVAVTDQGIVLIQPKGNTARTLRAWKSTFKTPRKGSAPDRFKIADANGDGSDDLIVLGEPSFVISAEGKPLGTPPKGCNQTLIADFTSERGLEVACRKGSTVRVTTLDGQFLREHSVRGLRFESCTAGDTNGDLKADLECKVAGKSKWARIDLANEAEIGLDFDSPEVDADMDDAPDSSALLQGNTLFDLNNDGSTEESLLADGDAIVVRSKSKKAAFGRYPLKSPTSALLADIDNDGKQEIFVGGNGQVLFIDDTGKLLATLNANPTKLKRSAAVEFAGLSANAIEDTSNATLEKAFQSHAKKLASCYESTVRSNPFADIGRSIWTLHVTDKGTVKKAEKYHSAIQDKRTNSCLSNALKKIKLPKAKSSDASVTVTLSLGYIDE